MSTIRIIGGSEEMVPPGWRQLNVVYLGIGDAADVEQELRSTDLFLAPIANRFGSKIKLLEALSFATPFIATDAAMSGLPFISDAPRFDLDAPEQAALLARDLIHDADRLQAISNRLKDDLRRYLTIQAASWGVLAEEVISGPI